MLFVQSITITYGKDLLFPQYANERRNMRFFPVKCDMPDENTEVLVDTYDIAQCPKTAEKVRVYAKGYGRSGYTKLYGSEIFEKQNWCNLPVDKVVKVVKHEDEYEFIYRSYNKKAFTLKKGEYGRVMYNYRRTDRESRSWIYTLCIINYINEDSERFREKIFCRKVPDREFTDMKILQ